MIFDPGKLIKMGDMDGQTLDIENFHQESLETRFEMVTEETSLDSCLIDNGGSFRSVRYIRKLDD